MSFNILYVENRDKDWEPVASAVAKYNELKAEGGERLHIERARTPEEVSDKLDLRFDVILADVFFDDPETGYGDIVERLSDIIRSVKSWRARQPVDRSIPIIAYTGMGKGALQRCLAYKRDLFDIWDKNTAQPDYITWRLSRLAVEVARSRPDARTQQLIAGMEGGARWDDAVKDMVRRYDLGWTERDQIERAGEAIGNIAHRMGVWEQCEPMWSIMKRWEWIGRAASSRMRGHARHVVNVFWLGYYLINTAPLEKFFKEAWRRILAERPNMKSVASERPKEALSDIWFYAGLFHDMAACVEKAQMVVDSQADLTRLFFRTPVEVPRIWEDALKEFGSDVAEIAGEFGPGVRRGIESSFAEGLERHSVDHGLLAAVHLRRSISKGAQACLAKEAARAVVLHNLFPEFEPDVAREVSWETEPVACLLLLCDQLQTWDRERADAALKDDDRPQRAELSDLVFERQSKRPRVTIQIDYIAPAHIMRSSEIYERVKDELERVLKARPDRSLRKIAGGWPFDLIVESSLSGKRLKNSDMIFG